MCTHTPVRMPVCDLVAEVVIFNMSDLYLVSTGMSCYHGCNQTGLTTVSILMKFPGSTEFT